MSDSTKQISLPRRGQFYKGIEWLACWLLDNVEGETVTEEQLRPWAIQAWKEHLKRANGPTHGTAAETTGSPVISAQWHAEYLKASDRAIRMQMQRDEARREAERWRDCFKTGMSMQPKAPSQIFPWENDKIQP